MTHLAELFVRYRDTGDVAALAAVFDRTAPRLLSLALHLCREPADAEDALQTTFLIAIRKAQTFDGARPLEPWLFGILVGEARNAARRARVRRGGWVEEPPSEAEGPNATAERRELVEILRRHADALPADQRQVVLLQLQHGLAPAEIAEVLGVKPGAVRMRLHRAVVALRRWLPASLGGAIGLGTAMRGVAQVRGSVLETARRLGAPRVAAPLSAGGAVAAGGFMLTKKVVAALVAAVVLLIAVRMALAPSAKAVRSAADEVAVLERAAVAEPHGLEAEPTDRTHDVTYGDRSPVAASGDLTVRLRFADSGEAVPDARVGVWLDVGDEARSLAHESGARGTDPPHAIVRTDSDGIARFQALPAREIELAVEPRAGRSIGERVEPERAVVAPGTETIVGIEMECGIVVTGRVVDEAGQPVTAAEILVAWSNDSPQLDPREWRRAARSDAAGGFRVLLAHGENYVTAQRTDAGPAATYVVEPRESDAATVTVVLPLRGGRLVGTVVDEHAVPIPGAAVIVTNGDWQRYEVRSSDGARTVAFAPIALESDRSGGFEIPCLPSWKCMVTVRAEGRVTARQELQLGSTALERRTFVLHDAVQLHGTVRDVRGAPVPLVTVDIDPPPDGELSTVETDDLGCFRFTGLRRGELSVRAIRFGHGRTSRTLELTHAEQEVELVLLERGGLQGRLVDEDGEALVGWELRATDRTRTMSDLDRAQWHETVTGADGAFALPDLGPHRFRLTATAPAGSPRCTSVVAEDVGPREEPIVLIVPPNPRTAWITGRILGPDGRALCEARVEVLRRESFSDGRELRRRIDLRRSDANGVFEFGSLAPAAYRVGVEGDGFLPAALDLDLRDGERRDLGTIRLAPAARLEVELVDALGRPWPHTPPTLRMLVGGDDWTYFNGRSGAIGLHRLARHDLAPGEVVLRVDEPGVASWPERVLLTGGHTSVARIAVEVAEPTTVGFTLPPGVAELKIGYRVTDHAGRLLLDDRERIRRGDAALELMLPRGTWRLEAESDTGTRYAADVAAPATGTIVLAELPPRETK